MSKHAMPLGVTAVMFPELDFTEQLALCQKFGVTHYSLRPRIIPADQRDKPWGCWGNHKFDLTPARLLKEAKEIRKQLDDAGIKPFGTVPSTSVLSKDEDAKIDFEGAAAVGAGRVRVGPMPIPGEGAVDYPALLKQSIEGYQRLLKIAKPLGIKMVIETHAHSLATSPGLALNICKEFSPTDVGVIFDMANFGLEGYLQPRLAVAVIKDYIDHVHLGGTRRVAAGYDNLGFEKTNNMMCPLTASALNIPDWVRALHQSQVNVPLVIEDYTANVPGALRLEQTARSISRVLESL